MSEEAKKISRFHTSNFLGTITIQCNLEFAAELYDLIRKTENVSTPLFSLTEKLRTQFYHMNKLDQVLGVTQEGNTSNV